MMSETTTLPEAVMDAASCWPVLQGRGDPNTVDVLHVARFVSRIPNLMLPGTEPPKDRGVEIVDLVEKHFIDGELIRNLPNQALADQAWKIATEILDRDFIDALEADPPGDPAKACAIALYTWHGCICMAKCLRLKDSSGHLYTRELREAGHNSLLRQIAEEEMGGRWIRYGMSLAKPLERGRGNSVTDSWVPHDSPYWK